MKKTKGFFNTNRKVRIVDVLFKRVVDTNLFLIWLSDNNSSTNCVASTHILRIDDDFDRLLEKLQLGQKPHCLHSKLY